MTAKEFGDELAELMNFAVVEGVHQGKISFSEIVGTLEMAKMDIHRHALKIAELNKKEQSPLILVPDALDKFHAPAGLQSEIANRKS